jgi:hypothetical protein
LQQNDFVPVKNQFCWPRHYKKTQYLYLIWNPAQERKTIGLQGAGSPRSRPPDLSMMLSIIEKWDNEPSSVPWLVDIHFKKESRSETSPSRISEQEDYESEISMSQTRITGLL